MRPKALEATEETLRRWLEQGRRLGATHVAVVIDRYEWSEWPLFVLPSMDVVRAVKSFNDGWAHIELVFDLAQDLEAQLKEPRAWRVALPYPGDLPARPAVA